MDCTYGIPSMMALSLPITARLLSASAPGTDQDDHTLMSSGLVGDSLTPGPCSICHLAEARERRNSWASKDTQLWHNVLERVESQGHPGPSKDSTQA